MQCNKFLCSHYPTCSCVLALCCAWGEKSRVVLAMSLSTHAIRNKDSTSQIDKSAESPEVSHSLPIQFSAVSCAEGMF